jgi:hypothetical protein
MVATDAVLLRILDRLAALRLDLPAAVLRDAALGIVEEECRRVGVRPRRPTPLPAVRHLVARDRRTGEVWALRATGDALTGVVGPLRGPDAPPAWLLPHLAYDDGPDASLRPSRIGRIRDQLEVIATEGPQAPRGRRPAG